MTCAPTGLLARRPSRGLWQAAALAVAVAVLAWPTRAAATDFPPLAPPSLSHRSQFGLALLTGSGFRVLVPYAENVYCGQPGERVCSGRLPFFLDVQPSYGLGPHWDVIVDLRFWPRGRLRPHAPVRAGARFPLLGRPRGAPEIFRHAPAGLRHHRATQSLADRLRPRVSQQQRTDVRGHAGPGLLRPGRRYRGLRPLVAIRDRFGRGCSSTLSVARLR